MPPGLVLPEDAQRAVEAVGSSTYDQERQGHPRKRQVELVAPIADEEAVPQVHREYRDDHHPDESQRCQRRQEAQYHQYPADKLRESGQDRHGLGRLYTQLLEHLGEARDPRPAEATEELLGTMTYEDHTQNQPQHQQPYVDHFEPHSLNVCPTADEQASFLCDTPSEMAHRRQLLLGRPFLVAPAVRTVGQGQVVHWTVVEVHAPVAQA